MSSSHPTAFVLSNVAFRESQVASGIVTRRVFQLTQHGEIWSQRCEGNPSTKWTLRAGSSVSDIKRGSFKLKSDSDSLLKAWAKGDGVVLDLAYFTLSLRGGALPWSNSSLTLCFQQAETAETWHQSIEKAIPIVSMDEHVSVQGQFRDVSVNISDTRSTERSTPNHTNGNQLHVEAVGVDGTHSNFDSGTLIPASTNASTAFANSAGGHGDSAVPSAHVSNRSWLPVRNVNGVAVYMEEEGPTHAKGAIMASTVVRAPPKRCFHALLQTRPGTFDGNDDDNSGLPFTAEATVLEVIDAKTQVVRHVWAPSHGLLRDLCCAREIVALRSWRKEPDGTYIVLYQSVDHRKVPRGSPAWLQRQEHVRAHVQVAGFTIAPLLRRYRSSANAESQECLVTLVFKADLGGRLSEGSCLSKLFPRLAEAVRWTFQEPLITSIVVLRDWVEQSRFVAMPCSMAAREDDDDAADAEAHWFIKEMDKTRHQRMGTFSKASGPVATSSAARRQYQRTTTTGVALEKPRDQARARIGSKIGRDDVKYLADHQVQLPRRDRVEVEVLGEQAPTSHESKVVRSVMNDDTGLVRTELEDSAAGLRQHAPTSATPSKWEAQGQAIAADGASLPMTEDVSDAAVGAAHAPIVGHGPMAWWAVGGTTPQRFWSNPGTSNLRLRGANYLKDRIKFPTSLPMFDLYASDLVGSDTPLWHVGPHLPSLKACDTAFALILNLIYPTPHTPMQNLITIWTAPVDPEHESIDDLVERWGEDAQGTVRAFFTNFKPWMTGEGLEADRRRNRKFKLIPRVVHGSWVVKQSVGTTPVLLGQKLSTKYFKGSTGKGCRYLEVDVDITSNSVANTVTKLVVKSITSLVVDLAPLVEGQSREELPERLLGSVRYDHLDLKTAALWDAASRSIVKGGSS